MTKLARLLVGSIVLLAAGAALPLPSTAWAAPPAPGPAPSPRIAVTPPTPFQDQERAAFSLSTLTRFARQAPNRTPFELRFEAALAQHPSARAAALRMVEKYEHMTVDRRRLLLGNHHDATTRVFTDAQALSLAKGPVVASGTAHPIGAKPPNVLVNYVGLGCTKSYVPVDAAFGAIYVFHDSPTQPTVTRIKLPGGGQTIPNLTPGSYSAVGATTLYRGPSDAGILFFESLFVDPVSKPDDLNAPFTTVDEIVDFGVAHAAGAFPPGVAHTGAETLDALAAALHVFFDIWTKSVQEQAQSIGAPMRITRIQSAELQAAASAQDSSAGPLHYKLSSKHSEYLTDYTMYFGVSPAVAFAAKPVH